MEKNSKEPRLCTRCGERPANNGHDWCSQCKNSRAEENTLRRGFGIGALMMRQELVAFFGKAHPAGMLRVAEVVNIIAEAPAPTFPSENSEKGATISA